MERAKPASIVSSGSGEAGDLGGTGSSYRPGSQAGAANGLLVRPSQPTWEKLARRTAYWTLVTAGRPLHRTRMLPGFLIVGAERCGTTSLWDALGQHPAMFSAVLPRKELHYFDWQYTRGLDWYQCHFPLKSRAGRPASTRVR